MHFFSDVFDMPALHNWSYQLRSTEVNICMTKDNNISQGTTSATWVTDNRNAMNLGTKNTISNSGGQEGLLEQVAPWWWLRGRCDLESFWD